MRATGKGVGSGVGTGKGTGKSMRSHLSKLPFGNYPSVSPGIEFSSSVLETCQNRPGKWGRPRRGQAVFKQIPWNPVKVRLKSGRDPLKTCVFRDTRRTPTGLKSKICFKSAHLRATPFCPAPTKTSLNNFQAVTGS